MWSFKQLYFFSGFNSGPVYHLRVVEQKLSLSFASNLSTLVKVGLMKLQHLTYSTTIRTTIAVVVRRTSTSSPAVEDRSREGEDRTTEGRSRGGQTSAVALVR